MDHVIWFYGKPDGFRGRVKIEVFFKISREEGGADMGIVFNGLGIIFAEVTLRKSDD